MYDYYENIRADVQHYFDEKLNLGNFRDERGGIDWDEVEEFLNDELWTDDSVTGNGSGSYLFSTWEAEEALCHNWDLLYEALQAFDCQHIDVIKKGVKWADVTIRCYLLPWAIAEVIEAAKEQTQ
jgi:hypothetical protein